MKSEQIIPDFLVEANVCAGWVRVSIESYDMLFVVCIIINNEKNQLNIYYSFVVIDFSITIEAILIWL